MNLLIICPAGRAALDAVPEHFAFSHGVDVGPAWIGMVEPASYDAPDGLSAAPGVVVMPVSSDPSPLPAALLAHFSHIPNLTASETSFSLRRKLFQHHGFAPFRPEFEGKLG